MAQNDKIKELVEELKSLSKTDYYQIKIIPNITPEIFDSKLGGLPYWTPDKNYPTNSNGEKLILLAQINFDREKVDSPIPANGMLQFFITNDDMLGMNDSFKPKFLRQYAQLHAVMNDAIGQYITDVKDGSFPNEAESY
jgi:uncharacterized protein YwqG